MNQRSTQQISATTEDLPQSGSEDDDETWLTEPTGCKTTTSIKVTAEAINTAEASTVAKDPFHQHSRTQPVAEPDLPRTTTVTREYDLPGPLSRDDDEDSSPLILDSDLADHVPCSTRDMTTSGHENPTLTQSGFLMATLVVGTDSKEWVSTGSTAITSPNQLNLDSENAHLTYI